MNMDIELINERISKMEAVKQSLLKLKKENRDRTLKEVNGIISNLKRWKKEIEKIKHK